MLRGITLFIPKKKTQKAIAFILLLILCIVVASREGEPDEPVLSYNVANKIIVIDPGHGGVDTGATRGNIVEKDITLKIGMKLAKELSQAGAAVIMTRSSDTDLVEDGFTGRYSERHRKGLENRVKKANEAKAGLFISIHTNADPNPRWSGAQTFYSAQSETSKILAESIQDELTRILENTNRKALAGDYFVINNTKMPAVIVEVGFISNPKEGQLLCDDIYQTKVAHAICSGIIKSYSYSDTAR